jgi:glucose-6-phosphate 1-dehydrogenase
MVKQSGDQFLGRMTELMVTDSADPQEVEAYEELLDDAMHGNQMHFARQDYVEEAWRIVDPVLDNATPVHFYPPGTWGPSEADALINAGAWANPRMGGPS